MYIVYLVCATAGGTVLVLQFVLALLGIGGSESAELDPGADVSAADLASGAGSHYDTDAGEGPSAHAAALAFKYLSLRTIVAFFAFFGLTGLLGLDSDWGSGPTIAASLAAGFSAFYLVGWIWRALFRLESSGNLDLRNAIGQPARVYLGIPSGSEGRGKIHIEVQGRTVELDAVSQGEAPIPSGARVRVIEITGPDCVRVEALA
jgi:hypothetical protein